MRSISMEVMTVGDLEPEEVSPETGNPRVPADAHGGLWYILVVTDANNDVDEIEEENNVLAIPFMVDVDTPRRTFLISRFSLSS